MAEMTRGRSGGAGTVIGMASAVDVLESKQIPPHGLIVPPKPWRDCTHIRVDHRLAALPNHPGMIDAKPLYEHPTCIGIKNHSEL